MSEMPYVVGAYTIAWLAVLGYAMYLFVRSRATKRRLAELQEQASTERRP